MKIGTSSVVSAASKLFAGVRKPNLPLLLDLDRKNLVEATMVCRPSKRNRSPYVADVRLKDGREAIAHVPALDMGGKCVPGAKLLLKIARDRKGNPVGRNTLGKYGTPKCEFITQLLWNDEGNKAYETWVAAHPSLGEKLAESIVSANLLGGDLGPVESYQREVRNICGADMRVDFVISHQSSSSSSTAGKEKKTTSKTVKSKTKKPQRSVLEVKTVIDTDISASDAKKECNASKKILFINHDKSYNRAGIFPWGTCKQKGPDGEKVVSARAIRHVDELARIAKGELLEEQSEKLNAAVLFIVGRGDVELFRPNREGCASFARHLEQAHEAGVHILAHRIIWGEGDDVGRAYWGGRLPVKLD
eukprot:g1432.t1